MGTSTGVRFRHATKYTDVAMKRTNAGLALSLVALLAPNGCQGENQSEPARTYDPAGDFAKTFDIV